MQRHRTLNRTCLVLLAAGPTLSAIGTTVFADSVPESILIQERAEKAYESAPIRPIDRGNAHHRDFQKDEGDGAGGAYDRMPADLTPPAPRKDTK